jgi:ribonuclease Z
MAIVARAVGRVRFELRIAELEAGQEIIRDGYRVAPFPVAHRGSSLGYVLFEDERPGTFDPEAAARLGLVPGPEFGRVQRGETIRGVTPDQIMGPPRPGRKLAVSGDTMPCESLRMAAYRADLLVHEATFAEEERERAAETGHSTAAQAAEIARAAEVSMLALTHFSTRYPAGLLRDEARAIFPSTVIPRDFDRIEIPFPERGGPELVRWSEQQEEQPAVVSDVPT